MCFFFMNRGTTKSKQSWLLGAFNVYKRQEVGKVLINDEYPFALIKYLDENFKKNSELKSENAILRIKMPNWIP